MQGSRQTVRKENEKEVYESGMDFGSTDLYRRNISFNDEKHIKRNRRLERIQIIIMKEKSQ